MKGGETVSYLSLSFRCQSSAWHSANVEWMKDLLTRKSAGARVECQLSPHQIPRPGHTRHTASHPRHPYLIPPPASRGRLGRNRNNRGPSLTQHSLIWVELQNYWITGYREGTNWLHQLELCKFRIWGPKFLQIILQHRLTACCLSKTF